MTESERRPNVVANFWEWYQRRQARAHSPLARFAIDKCEETYSCSDWDGFDYWFSIYRRERYTPKILMLAMIGNGADDGVCQCRALSVS
jgi:hypothetical protein